MYCPINNYALTGNLRSCVLISIEGSIDWAPVPYLHSASLFANILDDEKGGYWKIFSNGEDARTEQFYLDGSAIVVTRFITRSGVFEVSDFMPVEDGSGLTTEEVADFNIYRRISCISGNCKIRMICYPRFDYAQSKTSLEGTGKATIVKNGTKKGVLASTFGDLQCSEGEIRADFSMKEGEIHYAVFSFGSNSLNGDDLFFDEAEKQYEDCLRFWSEWFSEGSGGKRMEEKGHWEIAFDQSALVLKLLTFAPKGTIAAAPTTSLPSEIGGMRNWDYRFTWVRDGSFTATALSRLGYQKEAIEYVEWLVDVCINVNGGDPNRLKVLYDMEGREVCGEELLEPLKGYLGSKPVRVGNAAADQCQKDIYGSVLDMLWNNHVLWNNGNIERESLSVVVSLLADFVVSVWREPDQSIWEFRRPHDHYVYSKVMCWVALDRAIKLSDKYDFQGNVEVWQRERDLIKNEVYEKGWSDSKHAFTQVFDSENLDASLLTLSSLGFIDGKDERMVSTIDAIEKKLGCGEGLLLRYKNDDGLSGHDKAFLLTSFWLVDALFLAGDEIRARDIYESLLKRRNHVGLLAEQVDPKNGAFLGNFPQGYSHIGIINSGLLLKKR